MHEENVGVLVMFPKEGELLDNGNFIFSYEDEEEAKWKMVLTGNNGEYLESGYMNQDDESSWKDPANWREKSKNSYYITSFRGTGGTFCLYNLVF